MKASEVNQVIETICEKIGLGIDSMKDFVPYLAKYNIIHSLLYAFLFLLLTAIGVFLLKKAYNGCRDAATYDEDIWLLGCFLSGGYSLAMVIIAIVHIIAMIEWIVAPNVMAVKYILSFMGGD